ncbi:MAG TPA: prephenate dehydratase domain-containing protein [Polyangiaceae bacterium]
MPIDQLYALGPEGTYSDYAARRFNEFLFRTESTAAAITYTRSIPEALELASQNPNARTIAPIENSETGTVVATQDHLAKYDLIIEWELNLRIRFTLLADVPLGEVARLYVHPVALEQCNAFVSKRLPSAETAFTRSNVDSAVRWAAAAPEEKAASIVPSDYAPARAAPIQVSNVQNDERNTTRFVVVRAGGPWKGDFSRTKTSLLIEPAADRPGLLFEILSVFKKYDINLCRIESRPARTHPWAYVFYLDITNNAATEDALRELAAGQWKITLLGTFDALPDGGALLDKM